MSTSRSPIRWRRALVAGLSLLSAFGCGNAFDAPPGASASKADNIRWLKAHYELTGGTVAGHAVTLSVPGMGPVDHFAAVFFTLHRAEPEAYAQALDLIAGALRDGQSLHTAEFASAPVLASAYQRVARTASDDDMVDVLAFAVNNLGKLAHADAVFCSNSLYGKVDPGTTELSYKPSKEEFYDQLDFLVKLYNRGDHEARVATTEEFAAYFRDFKQRQPNAAIALNLLNGPMPTSRESADKLCQAQLTLLTDLEHQQGVTRLAIYRAILTPAK